jgi:aromatic ring-opening dioxygenase LigB subunit
MDNPKFLASGPYKAAFHDPVKEYTKKDKGNPFISVEKPHGVPMDQERRINHNQQCEDPQYNQKDQMVSFIH